MEKKWTVEEIREMLDKYPNAVRHGVIAIYKLQTENEKEAQITEEQNGVGYNGPDSEIMSSFAEQLMKGRNLSEKQMTIAKKKIRKYARQLCKIANKELTVA